MSSKERAPLGFGDELDDLDLSAWTPSKAKAANDKPKTDEVKRTAGKAAEATGFRSREPAKAEPAPPAPKEQRRRRTGRNVQFNIKTRQDAIDAFLAIVDAKGWGIGETFEHATELLTREYGAGQGTR
jgi:hypothetical protein